MKRALAVVSVLLAVVLGAGRAHGVEYRLEVVSLSDQAFQFYLGRGPALDRLSSAVRDRTIPRSVVLVDRQLRSALPDEAGALGGVAVQPLPDPGGPRPWGEIRWNGEPGQRVVFVVETASRQHQRLHHVGLGAGRLKYAIPYRAGSAPTQSAAVALPDSAIHQWQGTAAAGRPWVDRHVRLTDGVGLVVGNATNAVEADRVYIVIDPPATAAVFGVVLGWRRDPSHLPAFEGQGDFR